MKKVLTKTFFMNNLNLNVLKKTQYCAQWKLLFKCIIFRYVNYTFAFSTAHLV